MPNLEQIQVFETQVEKNIDDQITKLQEYDLGLDKNLSEIKTTILSSIVKDRNETNQGIQKFSDDLAITTEELKIVFEELKVVHPEIDYNFYEFLWRIGGKEFSQTEILKKEHSEFFKLLEIKTEGQSVNNLLFNNSDYILRELASSKISLNSLTEIFSKQQLISLLENSGDYFWIIARDNKKIFLEIKTFFTPDEIAKTFHNSNSTLVYEIKEGNMFSELTDLFTPEQLLPLFISDDLNLLNIFTNGNIDAKKFTSFFSQEQVNKIWENIKVINFSEKSIDSVFNDIYKSGISKFNNLKKFFTADQLLSIFKPLNVGKNIWNAVSTGHLSAEDLKQDFTPEQLSQTFKGEGGGLLWKSVAKGKVSFQELTEYFTPEQLSLSLESGGSNLWDVVIEKKISFQELTEYFTLEQLSLFLESDGRSLWKSVAKGKVRFQELTEYFTPEQLSISLDMGEVIFWDTLLQKKISTQQLMSYFKDPVLLKKSLEDNYAFEYFEKVLNNTSSKKEREYLGSIYHLVTGEYLENNLQKDSSKIYSHLMVKHVKDDFPESRKNIPEQEYNELMRTINHLHDSSASTNNEIRKAMIAEIPAVHLYKLLIHGRTELFTSTSTFVNHILPKILKDIESLGGLTQYLEKVDPEKKELSFFIEVFARYGKTQDILKFITKEEDIKNISDSLLSFEIKNNNFNYDAPLTALKILNTLQDDEKNREKNSGFIESIESVLLQKIDTSEGKLKKIYSLIGSMYSESNIEKIRGNAEKFKTIESPEAKTLSSFKKISKENLFSKELKNGKEIYVHRHLQVFVDGGDNDGKLSRESMATTLENNSKKKRNNYLQKGFTVDWKITNRLNKSDKKVPKNEEVFVLYREEIKEGKIYRNEVILSNVMESSSPSLDPELENYLLQTPEKKEGEEAESKEPSVAKNIHSISYRGHSTYVQEVSSLFENLREKSPQVFEKLTAAFWGSCGGASSLKEFQKGLGVMPPSIATSGTGTSDVNSPIIARFLEEILNADKELEWKNFNDQMNDSNLSSMSKYKSYEFPHKNVGAQFINVLQSILQ